MHQQSVRPFRPARRAEDASAAPLLQTADAGRTTEEQSASPAQTARSAGGHHFSAMHVVSPPPATSAVQVSEPGDPLEEQAERLADEVMQLTSADAARPRGRGEASTLGIVREITHAPQVGRVATIHRSPLDESSAQASTPTPPDQGSQAEPLAGKASGTTTVQNPVLQSTTVHGATLAEVSSALSAEAGLVTFDFSVSTSGDPITSAELTVRQTLTMPAWAERDQACAAVQRAWDNFVAALRAHEDGHVAIDRRAFANAHQRFVGKQSSETDAVSEELRRDVQVQQDAYDAATDHGRTGTPPTVLDTSAVCKTEGAPDRGSSSATSSEPRTPSPSAPTDASQFAGHIVAPTSRPLLRSATTAAAPPTIADDTISAAVGGAGAPLPASTRAFMEPRLGFDFSHVRIHADGAAADAARSVNARAFTLGRDIVFGAGSFSPDTFGGQRLIAHELAHVVQQGEGVAPNAVQGAPFIQRDSSTPAGMTSPNAPASVLAPPPSVGKPEDFQKRVSSPSSGVYAGKRVGTWGYWVSSNLTATARDPKNFATPGEASAWARGLGKPACILKEPIYLSEQDKSDPVDAFVVYTMSVDSMLSFTNQNTKLHGGGTTSTIKGLAAAPVLQFITEDGTVVAPEMGKDGEANYGTLMTQRDKPPGGDPFGDNVQAFGPGLKGLRTGNPEKDKEVFLRMFELILRDTAQTVIATSETTAMAKRDELGSKGVGDADWTAIDAALPELVRLNNEIALISGPMGEIARTSSEERIKELSDKLDRLNEERNAQLARYPLLSQFNEEGLREFAKMDRAERTKKLKGATVDVLADINRTRDNIRGGGVDVWELGPLVESTLQGLQIKDADFRSWALAKAKFAKNVSIAFDVALGVVQLGLGLAATALTGGTAAVAFAAGALTVGVAGAATQTADYFRDKAAANTDIDRSKALQPKDLDGQWAWIAVAWIGLVGDVATVMQACSAASKGGLTLEQAAERVAERVKRTPGDLLNLAKQAMQPLTVERARAALMSAVKAELRESLQSVKVTVLPDKDFTARFASSNGEAVTLVTKDAKGATSVEVVVKSSASERGVADEALHLEQSLDPELSKKMARATTAEAGWDKLAMRDQLAAYADKLEVEADACRRTLKDMHPEDLARHEVEETLETLESRSKDVKAALAEKDPEAMAKRVPWFDPNQPPFLFAKARLPKANGRWADPSKPGDCLWYSDLPEVKAITGGKGIPFRDGYPVFKEWAYATVKPEAAGAVMADADRAWARQLERVGKRAEYQEFFLIGDRELPAGEVNLEAIKRWRQENGFTWHHHQGEGNLMLLLPRDLHGNVPHTGRMAIARGTHTPE